jgi:hypothetical protein
MEAAGGDARKPREAGVRNFTAACRISVISFGVTVLLITFA